MFISNKKRKTIAVCTSGSVWESEERIINGIIRKCQKNDVNLLIFNSLIMKGDYPKDIPTTSNLVKGETEIFNLINYDLIDGVIVFGNSIYDHSKVFEIEKQCNARNIPVVNVNDLNAHFAHNVFIRNTYAMELVVEHLINVHHFTKINFIAGYPESKESTDRLNAYKKILTQHNIPIESKRIDYGHFWMHAIECTKKFLADEVPQAIVCANDTMAIYVCDYLKSQGYRIPQDIVVTGFDGIADADLYSPKLTTVRPDFEDAGVKTYELLEDLIEGRERAPEVFIDSELIVQESCGCPMHMHENHNVLQQQFSQSNRNELFNKRFIKTSLNFVDEDTSAQLFLGLSNNLWDFNFNAFYMCINSELEDVNKAFFAKEDKKYGFSEKMISMISYRSDIPARTEFYTKDLLPYDFLNGNAPVVLAFAPLYYKDNCLGYIAYDREQTPDYGELLLIWTQIAANEIGSFYVNAELEALSMKDYLTGLFNRRGMEKRFHKLQKSFAEKKQFIYFISMDLDGLKSINDKYGYEAGDNAIVQCANAIKEVFVNNSVCVRTGGDEFCVLVYSEKKLSISKKIDAFEKILKEYNKTSALPYEVSCSSGVYSFVSTDFTTFEEIAKFSDEKLYQNKMKRHKKI